MGGDVQAKVVIVEDDPRIAAHVAHGVTEHGGLSLLGTAGSLAEARALLGQDADLFILDLGLPDGNGIDLIAEIRTKRGAGPKILVLSVLGDQTTVLAAVLAGADGYLLKDLDSLDIGQQAAAALSGGAPLSPSIAAYVLRYLRGQQEQQKQQDEDSELSPREYELLQLLARGQSNRQAAEALSLSPHTVGDHVKSIYRKLGVSSRGEAMVRAFRSGLLRP
ncbi:response regulator transcription factor [Sphingomonas sp.]|uniref:response regulator n=1 Tax=Sphingomonas sp. TaxID=28214 RepID=UPI0025FB2DD3|nr:response regulator transcription factor [Sphingomonas sp.]